MVTLSGGRRLLVNGNGRAKVGDRRGVLMRRSALPERRQFVSGEVIEAVYLGASFKLRLACTDGLELIVRQPARTLPAAASTSRSPSTGRDHVF